MLVGLPRLRRVAAFCTRYLCQHTLGKQSCIEGHLLSRVPKSDMLFLSGGMARAAELL